MLSLIISLIALGLIITIHELGHFLFAKAFGVGVIEFSLGMGPRLASFIRGNTRYSLRVLPLGGSCMMLGEESAETENTGSEHSSEMPLREITNGSFSRETVERSDEEIIIDGRHYSRKSQFTGMKAWKRFLIIFGGPLFNFILAFLLSVVITASVGWDRPLIIEVTPGSAAEAAGISYGDTVREISIGNDRIRIKTARDIQLYFTANAKKIEKGEPVKVSLISEDGAAKEITMKANYDEESGRYLFGFAYRYCYEPCENLSQLIEMSLHNISYSFRSTIESLRMILRGEVGRQDVKGVVGMVAVMDESVEEASKTGFADACLTLFNIMMLLSASLGFMNLLPLPALDGGRLVFILIEMITGKGVPKKIEGIIHAVGTVLLLTLMLLVLFNDVWNLVK